MRNVAFLLLLLALALALFTQDISPGAHGVQAAAPPLAGLPVAQTEPADKIAPSLAAELEAAEDDMLAVIVTLKEQANLSALIGLDRATRNTQIVTVLQALSNATQAPLRAFLDKEQRAGNVDDYISYWVFNGLAVTARPGVITELSQRSEVARITPDEILPAPESTAATAVEPNLEQVNAPALWQLGYSGQGIVVASLDSGVYADHPDLAGQWRGGSNSWFDPYGQHPDSPFDSSGHGTQTMGVIVGRDLGGTAIGVAPDAQWIAAKIFDDQGQGLTSAIHSAFQWLLDPDGNPGTADAPHVVNNSWGYTSSGCNLEFQLDLEALRAMGILPVFSAGNAGPYPDSSGSPANNPAAFAVGGVDGSDQIYWASSRGPDACDSAAVFPDLVSPAVDIWSSNYYGWYSSDSGTSLAAPHVSGALALLLSALGDLPAAQQEAGLLSGVVDLGPAGPDDDFGYGRLDILAAYQVLLQNPEPTPTASATATATATAPALTATPTAAPLTNLALNRPVLVSSYADEGHSGAMAVDGDPLTAWHTKKAVGKKVLASEWISVDLEQTALLSEVELLWDENYATAYTLQASADNQSWSTLMSTTSGDGGSDAISFPTAAARYVRLEATAWHDSALRNWLQEFAIYGASGSGDPTPTSTATPAPSPTGTPPPPTDTPPAPTDTPPAATDTPTPTPTPGTATLLHVGDLDSAATISNKRWNATVIIMVHDSAEGPVAGATVSGSWSGGASGEASCLTATDGSCAVSLTNLKWDVANVTLSITDIARASDLYQPSANHDPDGDSDGTTITILQP